MRAWLAFIEANESRALVRAATSWFRAGSWSYAFYPADDSDPPGRAAVVFVVNIMAGYLAAVDRFVDPVGAVGNPWKTLLSNDSRPGTNLDRDICM